MRPLFSARYDEQSMAVPIDPLRIEDQPEETEPLNREMIDEQELQDAEDIPQIDASTSTPSKGSLTVNAVL